MVLLGYLEYVILSMIVKTRSNRCSFFKVDSELLDMYVSSHPSHVHS